MHFEQQFKRSVGGGTFPALGSDAVPTAAPPNNTVGTPYISYKPQSQGGGIALKSLLIGYVGPASANATTANVYLYDGDSLVWYLWSANVALTPSSLASVTMPAPADVRGAVKALEIFVLVANVATPNGTYTFSLSPGV